MKNSKILLNEKDYRRLIKNLALKSLGYNRAQRRKILRESPSDGGPSYMYTALGEEFTFKFFTGADSYTEQSFLQDVRAGNKEAIKKTIAEFLDKFLQVN